MITAIVNPTSADGRTARRWPHLQAALETELGLFPVRFTQHRNHAVELAVDAVRDGASTILAVGGDGTVHEIINGLCRQPDSAFRRTRLAIFLQGTGGDFAKSWRVPASAAEMAAAIRQGHSHPCDVVKIRLRSLSGSSDERFAINVADIGVGGQVVELVNAAPKRFGGTVTFFLASLRATFFQYRNTPMRIELDGTPIQTDSAYYFVTVANGRYFGGGMHIAPAARCDDGLFDVVLVGNFHLPAKFYFAWKLYRGRAADLRRVHMARGTRLTIQAAQPVFIEADGELIGTTDATFSLLPAALNLVGWRPRV